MTHETAPPVLFTAGYGRWPPAERMKRFLAALKVAGVTLLIDTRHSPCSSSTGPDALYGPKAWNLQTGEEGIAPAVRAAGLSYLWAVELGNPQKNDPEMAVLRAHLADAAGGWPVQRGLALLRPLVFERGERCCLLCACAKSAGCHRTLIAEHFRDTAGRPVVIRDLSD